MRSLAFGQSWPHSAGGKSMEMRPFFSMIYKAITGTTVDPKKLQFEKDLHYLYMVTAMHSEHLENGGVLKADDSGSSPALERANDEATSATAEEMFQRVNKSISKQVMDLARSMHALEAPLIPKEVSTPVIEVPAFLGRTNPLPETESGSKQSEAESAGASEASVSGTAQSIDGQVTKTKFLSHHRALTLKAERNAWLQALLPLAARDNLSGLEFGERFQEELGFQLEVKASSIQHADAGHGLWLDGEATYGTVIALHPGVIYPQVYHGEMADFPNVTLHNDYILSRYDGSLIDALPWGLGQSDARQPWVQHLEQPLNYALNLLEGRHPLALGHFINHPPRGTPPNVLLAPFDIVLRDDEHHLRPYLPYVTCHSKPEELLSMRITGLALIAKHPLSNEELFVDYRFNSNTRLPAWYTPVDKAGVSRRWA